MVIADMEFQRHQVESRRYVLIPFSASSIDHHRSPTRSLWISNAATKSLVFGRGPHQCIGAMLARTELRVFLQEWTKRIPHFEVKSGETPVPVLGSTNGWLYLPLTWKVA